MIIKIRNVADKYLGKEILKCFSLLIVQTNPHGHTTSLSLLACNHRLVGMPGLHRGLSALTRSVRFFRSLTQSLHFYDLFGQE